MTSPDTSTAETTSGANPALSPAVNLMSDIERLQRELTTKMAEMERQKEDLRKQEIASRNKLIDDFRKALGVTTDAELIQLIRMRGVKSVKAKRLPDTTLDLMKKVLAAGATAGAVSKHFGVSMATVHERKRKWGLVGRKNVKPKPLPEILKALQKG